jgi:hypothetical protein
VLVRLFLLGVPVARERVDELVGEQLRRRLAERLSRRPWTTRNWTRCLALARQMMAVGCLELAD